MTAVTSEPARSPSWLRPSPKNWRLALLVAGIAVPASIWLAPIGMAFWISLVAVAAVALAATINAWGRHPGPLLVAPAIALLLVMNIFPLMWSFGLSFFRFRVNRLAPPRFTGLDNYEKILTDPTVWDRLQTTALIVILTVTIQMVVGFLLTIWNMTKIGMMTMIGGNIRVVKMMKR